MRGRRKSLLSLLQTSQRNRTPSGGRVSAPTSSPVVMRSIFALLVIFVAGASAFFAPSSAALIQQQHVSRTQAPAMVQSPARVEIELEDGEP